MALEPDPTLTDIHIGNASPDRTRAALVLAINGLAQIEAALSVNQVQAFGADPMDSDQWSFDHAQMVAHAVEVALHEEVDNGDDH